MTRHAQCPWCDDNGPHVVRGRRPAQLLTDTVIVTVVCRMCGSAFDTQEIVTPAACAAFPPGGRPAAGVAQPT